MTLPRISTRRCVPLHREPDGVTRAVASELRGVVVHRFIGVDADIGIGDMAIGIFQVRREELADLAALAVGLEGLDRKSTRLNSSHVRISYAVFCSIKYTLLVSLILSI